MPQELELGQLPIVIIGAGIAGLSLAWQLVRLDRRVIVVDSGSVGSGASWAATAYLEPRTGKGSLRDIEWASLREWPELAAKIEEASGQDIDYRRDGLIHLAQPEKMDDLRAEVEERRGGGWGARWLDRTELRELEPSISPDVDGALYLPKVNWLDGRKLCRALAAAIQAHGSSVIEQSAAVQLSATNHGVLVTTASEDINASRAVICTGAAGTAIEGLPEDIPYCRPVRGVVVSIQTNPDNPLINRVLKHKKGPICPRSDGRVLIGTTYERGETEKTVAPELSEQLVTQAVEFVPGLLDYSVTEVTAGIRALAPDGLIHLGQSRKMPGVYYSLSHSGAGYLRTPVISREFARFVVDNDADCPLTGKYLAR